MPPVEELVTQKGVLRRGVEAAGIRIERKEEQDVLTFPASSEEPVERWFGNEILSHEKSAVRLTRAKAGAMPLLFNHDINDPIGVITDARIEESRLVVDAKLFKTDRAAEVKTMIEGGLRNVSLAYRINVIEENKKTDTFTATDWEPYEVSIVTVPADPTVGIGRGDSEYQVRMVRASQPAQRAAITEGTMGERETRGSAAATAEQVEQTEVTQRSEGHVGPSALAIEKMRQRAIENLCKANKIDDKVREHWIGTGMSIDDVADDLLKIVQERAQHIKPVTYLGLNEKEASGFSLYRAVLAAEARDWSKAPFEKDCVMEVAKRLDKVPDPKTFHVPYDVIMRSVQVPHGYLKRDMTVGTSAQGGYLVGTENLGFIEMLRNRSVAYRMGARRLSGLVGNVTIPRQSGAASGTWLANESSTISEGNQTLQQVSLSPKTVGAYTEVSRQLMLQASPSAEGIVTADLAIVAALAVDTGIINGSGASGQPTGIINTSGVGSVTGTSLAFDDILEFQTDVAGANVMPIAGGYATTPSVASLCIQRVKYSSTASPLWEGSIWDGQMQGFPAMSSLQVPSATMLFGDWAQVIVGEWGNLEITVNPYANFTGLLIGIRAVVTVDVALRYAGAFSIASSIT